MQTEYEVKFINLDHDEIRLKLKDIGAELEKPMRLMKRVVIETPEMRKKNAFIRVRDEGDKVTLTYKQFDALSVDGAKEYEVTVSDFQATVDLLLAAGFPNQSYQESKRETWILDSVEIVLDEWPWLEPYIEIEGGSESHVREVAAKLGLDWSEAVFGDVMAVYRRQYPHLGARSAISDVAQVRFGDPIPGLLSEGKAAG